MFSKPENWNELTPEEKRTLRLDAWVSGDGIEFDSSAAKAMYKERATLFRDAWELKKTPARVPIAGLGGGYALTRAGVTQKDTFYDNWETAAEAAYQFHLDFQPDSAMFLFLWSGLSLEVLGHTNMKWPGHGLSDDIQYQFVEQEYMLADEYSLFLKDPSDFMLRHFLPRINLALKGLQKLPLFSVEAAGPGQFYLSFADPELQEALDSLKKAADLAMPSLAITLKSMKRLNALGFPDMATGFGAAPFDYLGDNLRGTRGVMLDMHRNPEMILAACDKILEVTPVPNVPFGACPMVMIPLHKGSDRFMSRAQFEKFYWPTFKQLMLNMIDEGLIPFPFAEGGYNNRLEYITELPKGSTVWLFDQTDMHRAKDVLGNSCCIMGNVPITMIATGTPDQVKAYCKDLIDYCGRDGGYVMSTGCQLDHGREETIKAMIDFTREYGIYH